MNTGRFKSRFGWIFLVAVLAFSFSWQSTLIAQEDDIYALEEEGDASEPLPDETPADSEEKAASPSDTSEEPVEDDGFVDEGEETETEESEEPVALSADPVALSADVSGPARAGKHGEVIKKLEPHEDAVSESKELLEFYVTALMAAKKPDWRKINRFAAQLSRKDRNSSLGNYAQGMNALNAKKPDLGKAIAFFGKAKSAKKPHPDAAMAYYTAMAKKFWMIGLAVIALPVIIIINKRKKKKAAAQVEIDLGFDNPTDGSAVSEVDETDSPPETSGEADEEKSDKKAVKKVKKIIRRKVPVKKPEIEPQTEGAETATEEEDPDNGIEENSVAEDGAMLMQSEAMSEPEPESQPEQFAEDNFPDSEPGLQIEAEPENPESELEADTEPTPPTPVTSQPYRPSFGATPGNETMAAAKADLPGVKEISKVVKPAAVSVDAELETVWNRLSQRAIQGKISPHYRAAGSMNSTGYSESASYSPVFNEEAVEPVGSDVSIDLSEESLRSDLVGKLKMMAISDSELRELFAQKDPRHIPHLIEYVLTRPEPVRLAFVTRELGNYGDPAVIDMLASLLYNEDHRVALAAIQGLEKTQKAAAVLHICPFLKCDIPLLAQAARSSLSNFGAVKILQAFRDLPGHPDEKIRDAGVFVLSRMRGRGVEELLLRMLADESLHVRSNVILAMSYQKNPVYIDALRDFFRNASGEDKTLARKAIVYLQGFVAARK